jgi:hypothetical protein
VIGDSLLQILERQPELLRFNHELLDLRAQEPAAFGARGRWQRGDRGAARRPYVQKPLLDELRNDFVRSIGIDLESPAKRPHRRKRVARFEPARNKSPLRSERHLFVERQTWLKNDLEGQHDCTI